MLEGKGQASVMLMLLLPFILLFGFFLMGAVLVSLLKLPLAVIGAVLAFFFLPDILESRLGIGGNYALGISAVLSAFVGFVIYKMPLFWIVLVFGVLFGLSYVLETFYGIPLGRMVRDQIERIRYEVRR